MVADIRKDRRETVKEEGTERAANLKSERLRAAGGRPVPSVGLQATPHFWLNMDPGIVFLHCY